MKITLAITLAIASTAFAIPTAIQPVSDDEHTSEAETVGCTRVCRERNPCDGDDNVKTRCRNCGCELFVSETCAPARCTATAPDSFSYDNTSGFTLDEIKLAAKMATNVYWKGAADSRYTGGINNRFDKSIPYCWSTQTATYHGTGSSPYRAAYTRAECKDGDLDGWEYQGRIQNQVNNLVNLGLGWLPGTSDADIYFKTVGGKDICYVAIAGTDDILVSTDWMSNLGAANREWLYDGYPKKTFKVSKGFNTYYKSLKDDIKKACEAPKSDGGGPVVRETWVTGHSLGSAASDIMHAHGDAVQSITFGSPKAFENVARGLGRVTDFLGNGKCNRQDRYTRTDADGNQVGIQPSAGTPDRSVNFYTKTYYAAHSLVDMVAVAPPWGEHCADAVYELYYKTTGNGEYGMTLKSANDPPNGLTATIQNDGSMTHPMQAGYLKYLYQGCYAGAAADGTCPEYVPSSS